MTSPRAQFESAAGAARTARSGMAQSGLAQSGLERSGLERPGLERSSSAAPEAVFDRFDWSGAVGRTVQTATVRMEGRRDGANEVLTYDLDGTGLLACRDESADGGSVALHFVSASSRDAYQRALASVGYLNRAARPHTGERRFHVEVIDATGFPVKVGEGALWVDAEAAAAAEAAEAFDTLSPEVIRFDLDDHLADAPIAFEDAAFAAPVETPAAPEAPAAARPRPVVPAGSSSPPAAGAGDRFAALYGDGGYSVHWQTQARAVAARSEPDAPSIFRDSAEIFHIYRPAGATAAPGEAPQAAMLIAEMPDAFTQDDRVRVFRRRVPAPGIDATAPHRAPATADREALHFADMFEGEVDPNGLERDPAQRAERGFLFGLGRSEAA